VALLLIVVLAMSLTMASRWLNFTLTPRINLKSDFDCFHLEATLLAYESPFKRKATVLASTVVDHTLPLLSSVRQPKFL
jgi:hypothetical protein